MTTHPLVEICVEGIDGAVIATGAGADRLELCSALSEGGLSPGIGVLHQTLANVHIPVHAMVRPRGGDFLYSAREFDAMLAEAGAFAKSGVQGIVSGCLAPDGTIDLDRTRQLVEAARPASFTFHRAFDITRDPFEALETLVEAGARRVLTSGGHGAATAGREVLRELQGRARGRIILVACGSVRASNLAELHAYTRIAEFHAGPLASVESEMRFRNPSIRLGGEGACEYSRRATDGDAVRAIVEAARAL